MELSEFYLFVILRYIFQSKGRILSKGQGHIRLRVSVGIICLLRSIPFSLPRHSFLIYSHKSNIICHNCTVVTLIKGVLSLERTKVKVTKKHINSRVAFTKF